MDDDVNTISPNSNLRIAGPHVGPTTSAAAPHRSANPQAIASKPPFKLVQASATMNFNDVSASADSKVTRKRGRPPKVKPLQHHTNSNLETAIGTTFTSINRDNLRVLPQGTTHISAPAIMRPPAVGPMHWLRGNLGTANGSFTSINSDNLYASPHISAPTRYWTPATLTGYVMGYGQSENGNLASTSSNNIYYGPSQFTNKVPASYNFANPERYFSPEKGPANLMNTNLGTANANFTWNYSNKLCGLPHVTTNNADSADFGNLYGQVKPIQTGSTNLNDDFAFFSPLDVNVELDIIDRMFDLKLEEFRQLSFNMSRVLRATDADDISYKSCNCKKSMCLKQYCECFAGSNFCGDDCACQNCTNKGDYEDIVTEARNKTLATSPFAFCPKVVFTETSADNKENGIRPKHRKGCTCKKNKCEKRYCECAANGVDCSFECTCTNCQNKIGANTTDQSIDMIGKKQDNTKQFSPEEGPIETPSSDKFRASSSVPLPSSTNLGYDPITSTVQSHLGNNFWPSESHVTLQINSNGDSMLNGTTQDMPETIGSSVPTDVLQDISPDSDLLLTCVDYSKEALETVDISVYKYNTIHDMPETASSSVPREETQDVSPDTDIIFLIDFSTIHDTPEIVGSSAPSKTENDILFSPNSVFVNDGE